VHDFQISPVVVAQLVRAVEAGEHLGDDRRRDRQVEVPGAARDHAERLSVEELHRQVDAAQVIAHLERLHHVRMLQPRREPRLGHHRVAQLRLVLQILPQALDHDQLGEPGQPALDRQVHIGLPAAAEARDQAVGADVESRAIHRDLGGADASRGSRGRNRLHGIVTWSAWARPGGPMIELYVVPHGQAQDEAVGGDAVRAEEPTGLMPS